jgi:hypothetical protein
LFSTVKKRGRTPGKPKFAETRCFCLAYQNQTFEIGTPEKTRCFWTPCQNNPGPLKLLFLKNSVLPKQSPSQPGFSYHPARVNHPNCFSLSNYFSLFSAASLCATGAVETSEAFGANELREAVAQLDGVRQAQPPDTITRHSHQGNDMRLAVNYVCLSNKCKKQMLAEYRITPKHGSNNHALQNEK